MAQKFTETLLTRLDRKDAGKVIADAGYSGTGSLLARVAKSGRVSFYVKFQDKSAKSGQRKMLLNDRHPLLKQHGIRAFLEEYGVADLRKLAEGPSAIWIDANCASEVGRLAAFPRLGSP